MTGSARRAYPARATLAAAFLLTVIASLLLAEPVLRLPLRISLDFNEGWNAYHAAAVAAGGDLYRDPHGSFVNNYPPLSFLLVGHSARFLGDPIIIGRAVALASLLMAALLIALLVIKHGGSRVAGLFAAMWFLAYEAGWTPIYVGLNDPQWLAHAVMLTGLLVLPPNVRPLPLLFLAEALMVTAGFIKHNLLPLPAAVTLWLLWQDRRAALAWIVAGAAMAGLGLVAGHLAYGPDFIASVLGSEGSRLYLPRVALRRGLLYVTPLLPALLLGAWALAQAPRQRFLRLVALYAALALPFGVYQLGGYGVDRNALFDLEIAAALGTGLALAQLSPALPHLAGILALVVVVLVPLPERLRSWQHFAATKERLVDTTGEDVAYIQGRPGEAVCEALALCFWAGKPISVDLFRTGMQLRTGEITPEAIIGPPTAPVRFGLIQLDLAKGFVTGDARTIRSFRVPPEALARWLERLEPAVWRSVPEPRVFLVPRGGSDDKGAAPPQ